MIEVELDVHTHTLASGHAYGTIREMAQAAAEKGLKILGITEHAKGIPGTCDDIYFQNLRVVPRKMYGIELLLGSEINIIDYEGNLSLADEIIDKLDIRIAGIHSHCYKAGTIEQNTGAVLKVIKNPRIDIISHPDDGKCPLAYEPIVKAAKENSVLLELNNNSLNPINKRLNARKNNLTMLSLCMQYDVPILISSDAHDPADIARFDFVTEVLNEIRFPEKLIMNKNAEEFKKYLLRRRQ